MNSNSITGWHLEPTYRKLNLIDQTLACTIATSLAIPVSVLVDIFKAHDCGDVRFADYPVLAQRDYAQSILGAVFGILDNPPQPGTPGVVDLQAMSAMHSIIVTILISRASDLQEELLTVRNCTHSSKRIPTRHDVLEQ